MRTFICLISCFFYVVSFQCTAQEIYRVESAVIDLGNYESGLDGIITLDGDWEFYWGYEFTDSFPKQRLNLKKFSMPVPGVWNYSKDKEIKKQGIGIYHLCIMNTREKDLAIRVKNVFFSCRVFANNQLLASIGNPKKEAKKTTHRVSNRVIKLPTESNVVHLYIEVANHVHRKGGITQSIELGSLQKLSDKEKSQEVLDSLIIGILIAMGIMNFILFIFNNQRKGYFWLALFCLSMALRFSAINQNILDIFIPLDAIWLNFSARYLGLFLGLGWIGLYFREYLDRSKEDIIFSIYFWTAIACAVVSVILPYTLISYVVFFFQIFAFFGLLYAIIRTVQLADRRITLFISLIGSIVLLLSSAHDILAANFILPFNFIQSYGVIFFVLMQFIFVARNIEKLSLSLSMNQRDTGIIIELVKSIGARDSMMTSELIQLRDRSDLENYNRINQLIQEFRSNDISRRLYQEVIVRAETKMTEDREILRKKFNHLTEKEIDLCIFIISGYTNAQISVARQISEDSVKNAKYRLKQKLDLPASASLDFLLQSTIVGK